MQTLCHFRFKADSEWNELPTSLRHKIGKFYFHNNRHGSSLFRSNCELDSEMSKIPILSGGKKSLLQLWTCSQRARIVWWINQMLVKCIHLGQSNWLMFFTIEWSGSTHPHTDTHFDKSIFVLRFFLCTLIDWSSLYSPITLFKIDRKLLWCGRVYWPIYLDVIWISFSVYFPTNNAHVRCTYALNVVCARVSVCITLVFIVKFSIQI